jgi:hypothetical protein
VIPSVGGLACFEGARQIEARRLAARADSVGRKAHSRSLPCRCSDGPTSSSQLSTKERGFGQRHQLRLSAARRRTHFVSLFRLTLAADSITARSARRLASARAPLVRRALRSMLAQDRVGAEGQPATAHKTRGRLPREGRLRPEPKAVTDIADRVFCSRGDPRAEASMLRNQPLRAECDEDVGLWIV